MSVLTSRTEYNTCTCRDTIEPTTDRCARSRLCAPPRVPHRANVRTGCASRSSPARRASSPTADASRAAASRASACCSGSGMNAAHSYAASRSRHRHFCSRCCTISPKPLEETRSACCSRHELSADASRAAASRASACCSGSGMNAAHSYAASRSRHRHFCSRCCTISPKPLEETRSACCSRHELSADTPVPA